MRYANIPIQDYLDELAEKSPVPGGGSAAALFAAVGCALMEMALNYSDEKNRFIEKAKNIFQISRINFTKLIGKDITAYKKYSLSKTQNSLKESTLVPIEVCIRSYDMMNHCNELLKIVNKNLVSDVGCAVYGFTSAFKSAKFNVDINIKYIRDERFVDLTKEKITLLSKKIPVLEKTIIKAIEKLLDNYGKDIRW